jgi:hypothetical protein
MNDMIDNSGLDLQIPVLGCSFFKFVVGVIHNGTCYAINFQNILMTLK